MDPPTPPESLTTSFMELGSFPTFAPEELSLSPNQPRSPMAYNANKDFENNQRDCALFPAYTDYLYGPDARPKPPPSAALLPQPHFAPPVSEYQRSWIHPEELAYQMLHRRKTLRTIASRPKNNFPQLPGLTTRPANKSQVPDKQTAVSFMPTRLTHSVARPQTTSPSPSHLYGRALDVQAQRAPHQSPDGLATSIPQSRQIPQQGPKVLMPGEILTMRCQGISDIEKQNINTRVTMCWSTFRTQDAPYDTKQQSMAYLVHITNQVHIRHRNSITRDGIRILWRCVKMTRELPPQDPRHIEAKEFVTNFRQNLTPSAAQRVAKALDAMAQAERDGREPLDEVEEYINATHAAASPISHLAAGLPSQYPAAASSSPFLAASPVHPLTVRPSGQHPEAASSFGYLAPDPSAQYVAATSPVQYPPAPPDWAMGDESMYAW